MTLFHQYFERNARAFPGKRAVCVDGIHATYGELADMAQVFRLAVCAAGARAGDRVALCADVSPESIAAALGVFSAGCVLVPISQLGNAGQLMDQLEDCGAFALITNIAVNLSLLTSSTSVRELIPLGFGGTAMNGRFNCGRERWPETPASLPADDLTLDSLAAIFYSSGSTATPKGVLLSHRNMVAAYESVTSYLENTSSDVVLSFTAGLSSDYGFYNTMMPLLFGGTSIVQNALPSTGSAIRMLMRAQGVTGLQVFPPAILRLVDDGDGDGGCVEVPSLRYISSSGAALAQKYITRLNYAFVRLKIFSNYGMTECKRISYLTPNAIDQRPGSVGKAVPGVRTYLVDAEGAVLCEPHATGELVVAGDSVMQRYWNRPDLTAQVLTENFHGHGRAFFTGDLFLMDQDGFLYFVCRKSDIFYRDALAVNPAEIERLILEHEAVAEVAVVPIYQNLATSAFPRACVVLKRGHNLSAQELIQYCETRLVSHCIPAEVMFHASLPRTFGGKASRAGLVNAVSAS